MKILSEASMANSPAAILIDLDNTLYPYAPAHEAGLQQIAAKVSTKFGITGNEFAKLFAEARNSVKERLGQSASARNRLLYFQEMLEIMGLGASIVSALDFEQAYWRSFMRAARPFDGVNEFFDEARLRGIPLVLVTNLIARIQLQKLVYMGFDDCFSFVVTSEQIGVEKPHPAIFEAAIQRVQCDPASIWMIGDDIDADMAGAKKALGCTTLLKKNSNMPKPVDLQNVDVTFDAFGDLSAFLQNNC